MGIRIERVGKDDFQGIQDLGKDIGLNLPRDWVAKYFFKGDPSIVQSEDEFYGVVAKDDMGMIVGYYGVTPCELVVGGEVVRGYIGGAMGVRPGYGMLIFQILSAVKKEVSHSFLIGNTSGNDSTPLLDRFFRVKHGPKNCARIRFVVTNWVAFVLGLAVVKCHCPIVIARICQITLAPFRVRCMRRLFSRRTKIETKAPLNFKDERFVRFWNRFRVSNSELCLSRTPLRLQWLFGDDLSLGRCKIVCSCRNGEIEGYMVLRKRKFAQTSRFEILDWCAIGNDKKILRELLESGLHFVQRQNGCLLEYIGAPNDVDDVLDAVLTRTRGALSNVATWFTTLPNINDALNRNAGWFFGPYDGDRSM